MATKTTCKGLAIFVISSILLCSKIYSQQIPILQQNVQTPLGVQTNPLNIQSPNVASFMQFKEVPVSFFTGTPAIDIPLYDFTARKVTVPLRLSYHASGVKLDQHPGWVGMGWTLIAGGSINRVVKDYPDEYTHTDENFGTHAGFYWNYDVLAVSTWDQASRIEDIAKDVTKWVPDTQPDEFSFSYPGGSGSFYMDHTGNWKVKSDKPVQVIFNDQAANAFLQIPFQAPPDTRMEQNFKSFSGFTIIDENGRKYIFGGTTDAIEYQISLFEQQYDEDMTASTWYLTKIIDVDGTEVNFEYEPDHFIDQLYLSVNIQTRARTINSSDNPVNWSTCSSTNWLGMLDNYIDGKLISPVYLKRITALGKSVLFSRSNSTELTYTDSCYSANYSQFMTSPLSQDPRHPFIALLGYAKDQGLPNARQEPGSGSGGAPNLDGVIVGLTQALLDRLRWKQLDAIQIFDEDNSIVRQFSFGYTNSANERLTLLSLQESGKDFGNALPPYKFFYDNSVPLPPYLSNKVDHWGYFNNTFAYVGVDDPVTGLPYTTSYYGYREPNATYLYAGTLNRIVYPTGGQAVFTYEPHRYGRVLNEIRSDAGFLTGPAYDLLAGGLRIKKIELYDPENLDNPALTKEYFYIKNYTNGYNQGSIQSSGILGGRAKYYYDDYRVEASNDPDVTYSKSVFSSQSVLAACNNSMGNHIGYSEVTEKLSDGSYTKYFFSNFDTGGLDEDGVSLQTTRTAYEPYSSLEAERGLLIKQQEFSSSNVLQREKTIDYIALNKANEYVRTMTAKTFNVCPNSAISVFEGVAYKLYTYSYLPSKETDKIYDPFGVLYSSVVRDYTYDQTTRFLKTETFSDNSRGQKQRTYYYYPMDYGLTGTPSDPISLGVKNLQTKHILVPVIEKLTQLSDATGANFKTSNSTFVTYKPTIPVPDIIYNLETASLVSDYTPVSLSLTSATIHPSLKPQVRFLSYDGYNNILKLQKNNDIVTSYLWNANSTLPVAQVINASADAIFFDDFEGVSGGHFATYSTDDKKSGAQSYAGTGTFSITLPAGDYRVSFWAKPRLSSPQVTITGTTIVSQTISGSEWKCYETAISASTTISITPNDIFLDCLRIYPQGSQLTTYLYDTPGNIIATHDLNNNVTYYEYDSHHRLIATKDSKGNIVKSFEYHYRTKN